MEDPTTDAAQPNRFASVSQFASTPTGPALKMNHEFHLSDLPIELAAVLRDYDVDQSGSVSVAELVAGAQLMRQQAKKNKLMTKIVIALVVLLLLLLAGNFGLVWAVVVYNTPTTLSSSNVLTGKHSGEAVQVSSADFFYDSNGLLQLRNRGTQVAMDWVGSPPATSCSSDGTPVASCSFDDTSATGGGGRRRLLQDFTGSTASISGPSTLDMYSTQFTPTCNFSSPDFYTNSTYFFTGTCTFTKLVQMRTIVLPMLSSMTSAQVGGSIIDAIAWKDGAQTVYMGCYSTGNTPGSTMASTVLSASTTLANCETLAVNGVDVLVSRSPPYSYFGFTGSATGTGTCYACAASNGLCAPFQKGPGTCTGTGTAAMQVFQVQRSPNRYQTSGPGAMSNSPIPIAGGTPAPPAWSFVTLVVNRVDYVKNVFRDPSNTTTVCQANLLRFYVTPMTASGSVTSVSGGNTSYIDVCLTPMPRKASATWIGNYTVHSTGKSNTFMTSAGPAYYDRPSVTGFATPANTDFQSVLSYYCHNCPSGPYIDYSNLQYDASLFELPCTVKGISWKYRDVYSNQGCPAWNPDSPSAQSSCTWQTAETNFYGGAAGSKYCILTMDAFTPNEPVYTFDNQLSFKVNTGRTASLVKKTQAGVGDSGVPPLYSYSGAGTTYGPLWSDYFNTSDEVASAVAEYPWFISSRQSSLTAAVSSSLTTGIAVGRHLLQVGPSTRGEYTLADGKTYYYLGDCSDKVASRTNGYRTNTTGIFPCSYAFGTTSTTCFKMNAVTPARVCRCVVGSSTVPSTFCSGNAPVCRASGTGTYGCFQGTTSLVLASASILAS